MKTMQEMSRQTDSYFIVNPHAIQNLKFSKTVLSFEVPVKVKIFTFVFIIIIIIIIIIIYLFIYLFLQNYGGNCARIVCLIAVENRILHVDSF